MADVPCATAPGRAPPGNSKDSIPLVLASFENMKWAIIPKGLADNLRTHCKIGTTYTLPLSQDTLEKLPSEAKKLLSTVFGSTNVDQA